MEEKVDKLLQGQQELQRDVGLVKDQLAQLIARMGDENLAAPSPVPRNTNLWGPQLKDYLKTRALGPAARQVSRAARMQAPEALPSIASYAKVQSVKERATASASTDAAAVPQLPSTLVLEGPAGPGQHGLEGVASEPRETNGHSHKQMETANGNSHTVAWAEHSSEQHVLAPAGQSKQQQPQENPTGPQGKSPTGQQREVERGSSGDGDGWFGEELDDGEDEINTMTVSKGNQKTRALDPRLPWVIAVLKYVVWDVLDHSEPLRTGWLLLMMLLMVYVIMVTPYLVAFSISTGDLTTTISIVDLIVSIAFMFDIWVNLRTSFLDARGRFIRDRWRIARGYFRYWFWIDAVSSIPWDLILGSHFGLLRLLRVSKTQRLIKILNVVRVLRMLRVLHAKSIIQTVEELLGRYWSRLIFFTALMFTLVHWSACAFYYMAALNNFDPDNTWVGMQDLDTSDNITRYIAAVYWAFTTMCTVGYGDIVAISVLERICAIGVMVAGASMFAYLIGSVAGLLADMNYMSAKINQKMVAVDAFLNHRHVPDTLKKKVRSYYHYVSHQEVLEDEALLLAGLSASLRSQVILHMYKGILEKADFFKGKQSRFITACCQLLRPEFYMPGDVVMFQGDASDEMYFVTQGLLEARVYEPDSLRQLRLMEGLEAGTSDAQEGERDQQEEEAGQAEDAPINGNLMRRGVDALSFAAVSRSHVHKHRSHHRTSNQVHPQPLLLPPPSHPPKHSQHTNHSSVIKADAKCEASAVITLYPPGEGPPTPPATAGAPAAARGESVMQAHTHTLVSPFAEVRTSMLHGDAVRDHPNHQQQHTQGAASLQGGTKHEQYVTQLGNMWTIDDSEGSGDHSQRLQHQGPNQKGPHAQQANNSLDPHLHHHHNGGAGAYRSQGAGKGSSRSGKGWLSSRGMNMVRLASTLQTSLKTMLVKPEPVDVHDQLRYTVVGTLASGSHFGETTTLLNLPRTLTVVAVDHSELYSLARTDLNHVLQSWPELRQELDELCNSYLDQLRQQEQEQGEGSRPNGAATPAATKAGAMGSHSPKSGAGGGGGEGAHAPLGHRHSHRSSNNNNAYASDGSDGAGRSGGTAAAPAWPGYQLRSHVSGERSWAPKSSQDPGSPGSGGTAGYGGTMPPGGHYSARGSDPGIAAGQKVLSHMSSLGPVGRRLGGGTRASMSGDAGLLAAAAYASNGSVAARSSSHRVDARASLERSTTNSRGAPLVVASLPASRDSSVSVPHGSTPVPPTANPGGQPGPPDLASRTSGQPVPESVTSAAPGVTGTPPAVPHTMSLLGSVRKSPLSIASSSVHHASSPAKAVGEHPDHLSPSAAVAAAAAMGQKGGQEPGITAEASLSKGVGGPSPL